VEVALHAGKLDIAYVRWVISASLHIKADRMGAVVSQVLQQLPNDDVRLGDGSERNLQKDGANCMIGLWGRRNTARVIATCTQTAGDESVLAGLGVTHRRSVPGAEGWFDIIHELPRVCRHTRYPWYRLVIDQEAALLCQVALQVESLPGRIYEVNVDSILYDGPALEPAGWRCELTDGKRIAGTRRVCARNEPEPQFPADWLDLDEEAAFAHVLAGNSLYVEAHAGTGKTHFLRRCAAALREQGKTVQMCALTHVATANLQDKGAMTLARLTHSYGRGVKTRFDCLVVDEMSMIDAMLWCHLTSILHHSGAKLVIAGDWAQLGPVCDMLLNIACPSMQGRAFLHEKCGARLRLETCRRSDARLFAFYTSVATSTEDLAAWVRRAREAFPPLPGPSPINLVCCHKRRVALNRELQEVYKQPGAIWVQPGPSTARHNVPQDMWLWVGQELICAVIHKSMRRQWTYRVVELNGQTAVLEAPDGTRTEALAHKRVATMFRLSFARTFHAAQGMEWPRVRLWDCDSMFLTKQHLVVGLSRCLDSSCLDIM
jgi:hypothetical protein